MLIINRQKLQWLPLLADQLWSFCEAVTLKKYPHVFGGMERIKRSPFYMFSDRQYDCGSFSLFFDTDSFDAHIQHIHKISKTIHYWKTALLFLVAKRWMFDVSAEDILKRAYGVM